MRTRTSVSRLRYSIVAFTGVLLLAMSGCTDLDQITQFAKASQDLGKAFPGIADEAEASCHRANGFINAQNSHAPLPCEIYPDLKKPLVNVNAALLNYIASLGKLASDDLSKVAGGLDSLSADLKQADPKISTQQQAKAAAAGGLAKAITNLWANGYRQHELSKIIGENNQAVQQVADFLSDYAADKYRQSLSDEWESEKSYCGAMRSDAEPLATDLLDRKCGADKARIDGQLSAIKNYQGALATIAKTHQKLYDERSHWDAKELSKDLGPEIVSLGSAAVSVNKAF
jgi:hypothetical protein